VPSADEDTDRQFLLLSRTVQVAPESAEVKISSLLAAAISLVPSAEDATEVQLWLIGLTTQVTPESVEV
jgi:hypothetical protein